jgi:hypothetical protein
MEERREKMEEGKKDEEGKRTMFRSRREVGIKKIEIEAEERKMD